MRLLLVSAILFAFCTSVKAQNASIPFSGEREIIQLAQIKPKNSNFIKEGKQCGEYFLYRTRKGFRNNRNKEILTFRISLLDGESAFDAIQTINKKLVAFKFEEQKKKPTAEWSLSYSDKPQMIIRISNKDFKIASCLSVSDISIIPTVTSIHRF